MLGIVLKGPEQASPISRGPIDDVEQRCKQQATLYSPRHNASYQFEGSTSKKGNVGRSATSQANIDVESS